MKEERCSRMSRKGVLDQVEKRCSNPASGHECWSKGLSKSDGPRSIRALSSF
jgi:hypothetical protein